ncbi:MAG: nitroreductase/quinone reductase family protein [Chloroflexi bacterium]|nr:nitroreductase/quinone reductase family protein [Chloroflexota bacterium]MDA1272098.1 nitroreductase/quinone reductase family protein [Chloroflexota bacterium]
MIRRLRYRFRFIPLLSRLHSLLYVLLGGRIVSHRGTARFLLLSTTGRRSGRERTIPLLYVWHHGDPCVIASVGGNPKAPDWLLNLREQPAVSVRIGRDKQPAAARIATSEERRQIWPSFVAAYGGYELYQTRTTRVFPIIILTLQGPG